MFLIAVLVMPALALVAGENPPPKIVSGEDVASVPVIVETAPVGPQNPAAFTKVDIAPLKTGPGAVSIIDLHKVPVTPERDVTLPDRSHIQGEYRQEKGDELSRNAAAPAEHDTPEAVALEESYGEHHEGAKAFASTVAAWTAQASSGWIPPDTQMAVGPEYIVEAVNSGFTVFTKTGTQTRAYTDFEAFVNLPSPWDGFVYDPRVIYDAEREKFVILVLGMDSTNLKSYFWILTSVTSDPNGLWYTFRRDVSRGGAGAEEWLDFASLGVDHWGVYVSGNYFGFASGFSSAALWSENPNLLSGGGGGGYYWSSLTWPSSAHAFSVNSAQPHTQNASGNTFFVNDSSGAGTEVCLWTLHGERFIGQGGDAVDLSRVAIAARTYYAIGENVDQPGSDTDLDGGDCRVGKVVYAAGQVITAFTEDPDNDHSNSEIYIIALNTGDGTKAWDWTIWNNDYYMFFPSVSFDGVDTSKWMVGFNTTVPTQTTYAGSIAYERDITSDTNSFVWDHPGEGAYVRFDTNNRNRWGDYSGAAYDWTLGSIWTAQEYATSSNNWSTRIFSRMVNADDIKSYIHLIDPNGGQTLLAGNTTTVNWEHMNNPTGDDFYVYFDNGTTTTQQSFNLGDTATTYNWTVPNDDTTTGRVKVQTWNGSAWVTSDYSDNNLTVVGCTQDGNEPNDNPATATVIGNGNHLSNTICVTTDIDYFTFSLAAPSAVTLETSGPSGDTRMWLFESDGTTVIASDDDGGTGNFSLIQRSCDGSELAAGTYYVKVDEYNNNNHIDDYTMSLTVSACTSAPIFSDGFESSDTSAWSTTVP